MSSTSEVASTWKVASAIPGRIRLRHDAIRDRARAHRIEAELAATHGVIQAHARPLTSGLLVHYDPAAISRRQLLQILEELARPASIPAPAGHLPPAEFGMVNASLAVSVVAELAIPALLPVSAALLVVSSIREVREAWRELRRRRIGLPVLFTAIHAGTMISGHFVVAALMGWTYQFWRHRHREAHRELRRTLLPSLTQRPRFARLCVGEAEVEVPADQLHAGDRIVVEVGEMVPADGWLAGGFAVVDERMVRGVAGWTRKEAGDAVYAGSFAIEGRLYLEISGPVTATRAARLGRELAAATTTAPTEFALTAQGEAFAGRAVGPTLAVAGFGLVVGDLAIAAAILQPDYATGPGLGVSMESVRDISACALEGVMIRDASAFHRIASADVFLFDDHPELERAGVEVRQVQSCDGVDEAEIVRLAAAAFSGLADERAAALNAACAARRLIVRRDLRPSFRGPEITLRDRTRSIAIRDLREPGQSADGFPGLELSADGRLIGRIAFGRSSASRAAGAIRELRRHGPLTIGLVSDRPDAEAASLAATLGMDFHLGSLTPGARMVAVRSLRERGLKVAYVGDCRREPDAAREAYVAISLADAVEPAHDPAHVLVLRPDLDWAADLRDRARSHVDRVRSVQRFILIPNLACIAGAFLLGFTSLSVVVLTNLGTLAVYSGLPHQLRSSGAGRRGRELLHAHS
jgi:Cu2+-exporting ATPase